MKRGKDPWPRGTPGRSGEAVKRRPMGVLTRAGVSLSNSQVLFNSLPPRALDPFQFSCTSRGIPSSTCQQLCLLRGRTLGTAKKQQTQLGFANTADGFVLSFLPTPFPDCLLGLEGGGRAGLRRGWGWGKIWRRTNKFSS